MLLRYVWSHFIATNDLAVSHDVPAMNSQRYKSIPLHLDSSDSVLTTPGCGMFARLSAGQREQRPARRTFQPVHEVRPAGIRRPQSTSSHQMDNVGSMFSAKTGACAQLLSRNADVLIACVPAAHGKIPLRYLSLKLFSFPIIAIAITSE